MGYDVTNKQSFEEIKEKTKANLIYLLGNKIDLKDSIKVSENEGKEFADKNDIKYFQISVKNDINIQNFIDDLKINIENIDDNSAIIYGNPSKKIYRVIFIGDTEIGKTCLVNRLVYNKFDNRSFSVKGFSFEYKLIKLKNGKEILLHISDTSGYEGYRSLIFNSIRNSDCIIIGYDVTNREYFDNINNWYKSIKDNSRTDLIYLVAYKIDKKEESKEEKEARDYAKEKHMRFFQVSSKASLGIKEFLNDLVTEIIKR